MARLLICLLAILALSVQATAEDWPQWRGPKADGVWRDTGVIEKFAGPDVPIRWRQPIGSGYTGPTVALGRVYVMDRVTDPKPVERVLCFDEKTGKPLWSHSYEADYGRVQYPAGPRGCVTIHEGRAYSLGATGHSFCFDAASGDVVWEKDLNSIYSIELPIWGIAGSPVIVDDLVVMHIGGKGACVVALNRLTGKEVWKALSDRGQYTTPVVTEQAGEKVVICWTGDSVAGLAAKDGKTLWRYPWKPRNMPIGVATPVVNQDRVFCTSFYDGSLMLKLRKEQATAEKLWQIVGLNEKNTEALHSIISTPVFEGDYIYGVDSYGELRCLDARTGDRLWEDLSATPKVRWGTIHFVKHQDRYFLFNERGELLIGKLSPQGFTEISRAKLLEPTTDQLPQRGGVCWSHPAFANQHVFARNDKELVCGDLAAEPAARAADTWRAGAAKVVVTPEKLMWMAGYASRNHPAEGKLTELFAKALVLEDAKGKRAALITLDLIGIDRELSQSVCGRLEKELGLARDQVAINCSHTHTGPVVARNLRPMHYLQLDAEQTRLVDEYSHFLEDRIVEVVAQAIKKLEPATVNWGSGQATFAVNRRTNAEANVPKLREQGLLKGPVDHDVPVLAVRNENRELIAVAFGYACHSTVLAFFEWSGDYPAFAQQAVETAHPGAVALFWAGCGGDQNPLPRRTVELAQHYGKELAAAVERTLSNVMTPLAPELATTYEEVALPLGTLPTREQIIEDQQSKDKYVAARAKNLLEDIDAGRPLSPTYPYPIAYWRLGQDVQWVFLGGEVVIDYAVRIKAELTGQRTWVSGYSNDVMAYIPSRRVLLEGGYEGGGAMVYYGLPSPWAPEVEEVILREVHRQAK